MYIVSVSWKRIGDYNLINAHERKSLTPAEMENDNGYTLGRRKNVHFSDEELITFLRAYVQHPTSWSEIITDVKGNTERLPQATRRLYIELSSKQIRERLSTKLSKLLSTDCTRIENVEIRELVRSIAEIERKLVAPPKDAPRRAQDVAPAPGRTAINNTPLAPTGPRQDPQVLPECSARGRVRQDMPANVDVPVQGQAPLRDVIAAGMPSSDDDGEAPDQHRRRQKRKQPLGELVRENQLLYRRWMRTKVPKILRELGISSSSDDDDEV